LGPFWGAVFKLSKPRSLEEWIKHVVKNLDWYLEPSRRYSPIRLISMELLLALLYALLIASVAASFYGKPKGWSPVTDPLTISLLWTTVIAQIYKVTTYRMRIYFRAASFLHYIDEFMIREEV
jgi:hypothetical protein